MGDFQDLLDYRAPEVVAAFVEEHECSPEFGERVFGELKKWLWLCAERQRDSKGQLVISPELLPIDLMWHHFVLWTEDYREFCDKHLGVFVHHRPLTQKEKTSFRDLVKSNPEEALMIRQNEIRPQLEYIATKLGPHTVRLWYREIIDQYRKESSR